MVNAVGFFSDKKCFSGSKDRTIRLWDLNRGSIVSTFMCISPCIAADTDAHLIISGHSDGTVKVWSEKKKSPLIQTKLFDSRISDIKISSNSNYIMCLSKSEGLKIMDIRKENVLSSIPLNQYSFPKDPFSFDMNSDLDKLFLGTSTGKAYALDVSTMVKVDAEVSVSREPIHHSVLNEYMG